MTNGLSNDQFQALGELIRQSVSDVFEEKQVVTKADIAHLPTKDEFYTEMAKIHKQLDDLSTNHKALTNRVSIHSDQIEEIQTHLNINH